MTRRLSPLLHSASTSSCPVCGDANAKYQVVLEIMSVIQRTGRFSIDGLENFWGQFGSNLCADCRTRLRSIKTNRQNAHKLLKEANKLVPGNKMIQQNLAAVEKML